MAFKIVSGGLKLGGTATLEPEEPKFKVLSGGEITAPKFKVVSTPTPAPKFTGQPAKNWIGEGLKKTVSDIGAGLADFPAQIQDIMAIPSLLAGTPHPPLTSKLATETIPFLAQKATAPLGTIRNVPTLNAQNIRDVFKGKVPSVTSDVDLPSLLEAAIMFGIPAVQEGKNITGKMQWNAQLNKAIQTEKIRGVIMENIAPLENILVQGGIKLPKNLPLEDKVNIIISQAKRSPTFGSAIIDLTKGRIKPMAPRGEVIETAPITEPTPSASQLIEPEKAFALAEKPPIAPKMAGISAPQPPVAPIMKPEGIVTPVFKGKAVSPTGEGKVEGIKIEPIVQEAIANTQGAKVTPEGIELDLSRYQKEEQFGSQAIRTGVFYLPEVKSPYGKYYSTGKEGYGGGKKVAGRTTYRNPIIVKAGTGGKGVEKAYDQVEGKGAYQKMRSDVLENGWTKDFSRRPDENAISALLEKYGGNPDLAYEIIRTSKTGNLLPYAIQEHIAAHALRKAGYDAVISHSISGGKPRLSEVFDLRAEEYPSELSDYKYEDFYSKLSQPTGQKPPVEPPKTAIAGEPAPEQPQRPKINIETIRPDQYGKTPISKTIEKMQDRIARVNVAQYTLDEVENIRKQFIRRITKYKDAYLKEELTGIPSIYITKEGGIKPDEAMDELRNINIEITDESELKQFLQNLEEQRKSLEIEIQTYKPQLVTKKETTLLYDKIKSFEQGLREGKIRTMDEAKRIQTEVIELLETAELEPKDKVKFLRTLKNIQSAGQLKSALQEITDRIYVIKGQSERSQAIQDLRDLFNRLPTENLPLDYKERIDDLKDTVELKTRRPSTQRRIESMRQFVERMEANGEEINIPEEKLALLDKHTVDEFTTEELIELQETLQRFHHLGRFKNQLLTAQQNRKVEDIVNEVVNIVTKSKGLSTEGSFIEALKRENKTLVGKTKEEIYDFILKNLRPEILINALDDYKKGLPTQVIWDILVKANNTELENGFTSTRQLWDMFKNIKVPEAYVKKYNVGRFKNITKNNALFIYAHSKNDASLQHLYASGLTDKDIEVIGNSLSAQEKEAVVKLWEYYDKTQWPRIDAVYSEIEGVHLGKEDYYFPIMRLERISESYNKELEKELLKRFRLRQPGVTKGFTKERVKLPESAFANFDFFGTLLRNHEQVEHYVSFAREIRDVRKILYNPDVRAAIEQKFGKDYYRVLDKWFKDVSYGGSKVDLTWLDNLSSFLTENYVTSVLGYNLLSSLKSGASYLAGVDMVKTQASLKGLVKFSRNPLAIIKFINNKSVMMKNRDFTQEREWKKILAGREAFLGQAKVWQKFKEKSAFPMMLSDKVTVYPLWISAYDDYIGKGKSDPEAIEWADTVIRRTQPMGQPLYLPETFRSPGIAKTYTLFTNQLNQNFNRMYEQVAKFGKGGIGAGEFAKTTLYLMILSGLLIGYLARRRRPTVGEFIADSISQVAGGIVLVGRLVDALSRAITTGKPAKLGEAISPITFRPAESVGYALTAKKPETRTKHALTAASLFTGVPFVEIKRVLEGEPIFGKREEEQSVFRGRAKFPPKFKSKFKPRFK